METEFNDYFKEEVKLSGESDFLDFLSNKQFNPYESSEIELDYFWNFSEDPVITPTIIHEWDYLDKVISKRVTLNAEVVLSIGGGGTSKTHKYLTEKTKKLIIHNPGLWDVKNYPDFFGGTKILKVRGIGEYLPYKSLSINAIEIPSTLDHVIEPKRVISEAFRVLVEGGKIGITLGNNMSWYRRIANLLPLKIPDNHTHAHNFHFNSDEISALLKEVGFVSVETIGTAYLKLPKFIERGIKSKRGLAIHRIISNLILSKFLPANSGGMFIVIARKH
jgi:hypothetical protein